MTCPAKQQPLPRKLNGGQFQKNLALTTMVLPGALWYLLLRYLPMGGIVMSFLDYKLPTAMDTPELNVEFIELQDPTGPFGNKALGEPPAIPVAPAIRNAVLQATGIGFNQLPMEPQRLVAAFKEKGLI